MSDLQSKRPRTQSNDVQAEVKPKKPRTKRIPEPDPVVVKIEGPNGGPVDVVRCIQALLRPALPGLK